MGILKESDSSKWIKAILVLGAVVLCIITISFVQFIGDELELEAKIQNFEMVSNYIGIFVGFLSFVLTLKSVKAMSYLNEVFMELTKVIWPDKESTLKLTISIVIGVALMAVFFGIIDYLIKLVLELLY